MGMDSLVRIEQPPTKRKIGGSNPLPCTTLHYSHPKFLRFMILFGGPPCHPFFILSNLTECREHYPFKGNRALLFLGSSMKKPKLECSDTSGYDSSTLQIDVTPSASNSAYRVPIDKRVVEIEPES